MTNNSIRKYTKKGLQFFAAVSLFCTMILSGLNNIPVEKTEEHRLILAPEKSLILSQLKQLNKFLIHSEFLEKELKGKNLSSTSIKEAVFQILSSTDIQKEPAKKAFETLSLHHSFFALPKDKTFELKNYLNGQNLESLLELIEASSFLGLKNINKRKNVLETILIQNKIKIKKISSSDYKRILNALIYLEKGRKIDPKGSFVKWFAKQTIPEPSIQKKPLEINPNKETLKNITPFIAPFSETSKNNNPSNFPIKATIPFYTIQSEDKKISSASFGTENTDIWILKTGPNLITKKMKPGQTEILESKSYATDFKTILSPNKKTIVFKKSYKGFVPNLTFTYFENNKWTDYAEEEFNHSVDTFTFAPDSKKLYVAFGQNPVRKIEDNEDGLLSVILPEADSDFIQDFSDPKNAPSIRAHDTKITTITPSPNGKYIVTTAEKDPVAKIWDVDSRDLTKSLKCSSEVLNTAVSKDSKLIAIGESNGTVLIWDTICEKIQSSFQTKKPVYGLEWSPDSKILLIRTHIEKKQDQDDVSLWSVKDGTLLMTVKHSFPDSIDSYKLGIIFSPDGQYFLVSDPGRVTVWKTPDLLLS